MTAPTTTRDETATAWQQAIDFHGHACPGLAIGTRAALAVKERLFADRAEDEELVCISENDACGVDAIQALLGCTFGKGNMIFRRRGKQVFTFFDREGRRGVRVSLRSMPPGEDREAKQRWLLEAPLDEVFRFGEPTIILPARAKLFTSLACARCGENTAEYWTRLEGGDTVCLDCRVPHHSDI